MEESGLGGGVGELAVGGSFHYAGDGGYVYDAGGEAGGGVAGFREEGEEAG